MKDNYAFRSSTFMRALLVLLFMAVSIQWGFAQLNLNVSRGTLVLDGLTEFYDFLARSAATIH